MSAQWARKFKKVQAKKTVKSNKSISNFKNGQKSIFELGKSLKLPEMQFHEKNFLIYLISRVFFAWTFLNFLAHCAVQ